MPVIRGIVARIARAELLILLAVAPALLFPSPTRIWVVAAVPAVWICARAAGGRLIPPTPLNVALWALLAMVGVSILVTPNLARSLGKVAGVLLGAALYWAIVRAVDSRQRLQLAVALFAACGASLAVIGLVGATGASKFALLRDTATSVPGLIRGIPGAERGFNPNAVAGCLVLFLPAQLVLLGAAIRPAGGGSRSRGAIAAYGIAAGLTAVAGLLMQSRGAWAGLAAGGALALAWSGRRGRLALSAAALIAVMTLAANPKLVTPGTFGFSDTGVRGAMAVRVELWSRGLAAIQDFPVTGMGMNMFRYFMPQMYPPYLTPAAVQRPHAHNHLLQAGVDLGVPGLIAYLAIWLLSGVMLVQVYRRPAAALDRALAGALGAGLIAHFVFGIADAIPLGSKVGILFWLTLALIAALHRISEAGRLRLGR